MSTQVGAIHVQIGARTRELEAGLSRAQKRLQDFNKRMESLVKRTEKLQQVGKRASVALAAMGASLGVATRQATDYAGSVQAVHQQTGLMVESVQALRFAAEQSNTDIATLEVGLRSLVRRAAEAAQGNQAFARGFERLGVSVRRADGRLKDTETLLLEMAEGAKDMATEAEASAALMLTMGDAGRRLVPFMRQGEAGIRGLMDEAVSLGIVMDEQAVNALANLGDELGATGNRLGALTRDMAYRFSPAVSVVVGWVNQLVDGFFDLSVEQRQNIVRWTAYIGMVLGAVAAIGVLARVFTAGVGVLRAFSVALSFVFSPLVLYIALALAAIAAFKIAWETDWMGIRTAIEGAWEIIEPIWESMKKWVVEKAGDAWEWLTTTTWAEKWEDVKAWLTDGWKWGIDLAGDGWDWLKQFLPGGSAEWIEGQIRFGIEVGGALYDAIKTGLTTGDWSGVWSAGADVWRAGMKLYVTLSLFSGAASAVLAAIKSGLGVASTGVGALGSLGVPGALGVLSIGIALAEAWETGDYEKFAQDMVVALGAALVAAGLTRSPSAGAMVFTIALNFKFGSKLAEKSRSGIGSSLEEVVSGADGLEQLTRKLVTTSQTMGNVGEAEFERWLGTMAELNDEIREAHDQILSMARALDLHATPWQKFVGWLTGRSRGGGPQNIPSFASGGWTGNIPTDQFAGFVHGQEIVIPEPAHRKGLAGILEFLGVPGFQDGRGENWLRSSLETARPSLDALHPGLADALISGLDMLSRGVDIAREHFDELMKAIEDGPQAIDDAIKRMREYQEEQERAAQQQAVLNSLTSGIIGQMPILHSALQGMQAGAAFGPAGSAVGALAVLAMESETAGHAFSMINDVLGTLADTVGLLLEPLLPLIHVVASVLSPVFEALGVILNALEPSLRALFPVVKILGHVFIAIGQAVILLAQVLNRVRHTFLKIARAIAIGIGKIPFVNTKNAVKALNDEIKKSNQQMDSYNQAQRDLTDAHKELADLTYDEAMARSKNTDELEKATEALRNLPSGFRVATARYESTSGIPGLATGGYVPATPGGRIVRLSEGGEGEWVIPESKMGGGGDMVFTGNITIVADDPQSFERQMRQYQRRKGLVETGNPMGGRGRRF